MVAIFVALSTAYAWMTPAWEANDEPDHVDYVEVVLKGHIPEIGDNVESYQPPLYYATAALWQKSLGIPRFKADTRPNLVPTSLHDVQWAHDYSDRERRLAWYVHGLRMLSILFGAATVVAVYKVVQEMGGGLKTALGAALTVAVWPKFNVISGSVQNDSLVTLLCTLSLWGVVRWLRRPSTPRPRLALPIALGVCVGAAVLTKYTAIPVLAMLFVAALIHVTLHKTHRATRLTELLVAGGVAGLTCGWWLVRNFFMYGSPLGTEQNSHYLSSRFPGLIVPVSWTDQDRFFEEAPKALMNTMWYIGGWNQWVLPFGISLALSLLAAGSFAGTLRRVISNDRGGNPTTRTDWTSVLLPAAASLVGASFAILAIAHDTTQIQGRWAFTVIAPIAACLVVGAKEILAPAGKHATLALAVWPTVLLLTNCYALYVVTWPYRGL